METTSRTSYKYRSGAAALRCLSEGTAYFASPRQLNDSLEAKFELAGASPFIEAVGIALSELALQRGQSSYSFNKAAFKELDREQKKENQRFREASQRVGIFSTAGRPDNQPMWAYYCDNSKGVCFELEWPIEVLQKYQLWPTDVVYTREPRIHNRAEDLRQALLKLGSQNPDWTMTQLKESSLTESFRRAWGIRSMARAVSLKHADWQHEAELRMISPRAGSMPIIQVILKRVFFTRTDFDEWGSIMMLLHRLYPKVEIARITFQHTEPFVKVEPLEAKLVPI